MARKDALAVARSFVDFMDRIYAIDYLAWRTDNSQHRPVYKGVGSAERIEAAIDAALTA